MLTADLAVLAKPGRAYIERLLALAQALATVRDLAYRFGASVHAHTANPLTPWLADAEDSEFGASLRACARTISQCAQP